MAVNTLDDKNNVEGEQGEAEEQQEQPGGHLDETKSTIVLVEESARQLRIWLGVPGWCIRTILKEFAMCTHIRPVKHKSLMLHLPNQRKCCWHVIVLVFKS